MIRSQWTFVWTVAFLVSAAEPAWSQEPAVERAGTRPAVANEVISLAEEKVAGENLVRSKLAEGMPVWEAFRTYGVI